MSLTAASFALFSKLPLACTPSPDFALGHMVMQLQRCVPVDRAPALQPWVQRIADAMGYAGFAPSLRKAPLGPHVWWSKGRETLAASFVTGPDGKFDIWLSHQTLGAITPEPLPVLPEGAEVLSDQTDATGRRMLTVALARPFKESGALREQVMRTLGAEAVTERSPDGAVGGKIRWTGKTGWFEATPFGQRYTTLALYVEHGR